jgi:hypothetical protein
MVADGRRAAVQGLKSPSDSPLLIQELLAHISIGLEAHLMGKNGPKRPENRVSGRETGPGAGFRLF